MVSFIKINYKHTAIRRLFFRLDYSIKVNQINNQQFLLLIQMKCSLLQVNYIIIKMKSFSACMVYPLFPGLQHLYDPHTAVFVQSMYSWEKHVFLHHPLLLAQEWLSELLFVCVFDLAKQRKEAITICLKCTRLRRL